MNLQVKPTLIIIGTLLIGIVLGALISGTLADRRHRKIRAMMGPDRFPERLVEIIEPQDSEQHQAVVAIIDSIAFRMQDLMHKSRIEMRATIDSMAAELRPLLTDEQNARLQKHLGDRHARAGRMKPPMGRGRRR